MRYSNRRRALLRTARAQRKVDAFLVTRSQDVSYLTGFWGDDSAVALGDRWASLITDGRYSEQARRECAGIDIHVRSGAMAAAVADALKGHSIRRLGVQGDTMTLIDRDRLAAAIGEKKIFPLSGVLDQLRVVKDDEELRTIRKAVRIAQRALCELLGRGAKGLIGRTEREVAGQLDFFMRCEGADAPAFETIVATGVHTSEPHYRPGATRIRPDQPVLIDFGAMVGGYCCDLTRVVFTGRILPKLAEVYEIVLRAQKAGIAVIAPGVSSHSVDAAARQVVEEAGYGENFLHGLGHGIGKVVHEAPALHRGVRTRLRKGMVVTVEPGIYLPGIGGIRIEDDIVVTSHGGRRLSSLRRELAAMQLR